MNRPRVWNFDSYDWVDRYDELRTADPSYKEALRQLPRHAGVVEGSLVLDLGTGTGNSALPFLELGCRVVGLDPSERMLRQAETKASSWGGRLTLRRVDEPFLEIPYEDTSFDAIVSAFAIHHLDDDAKRRGVKEMVRVLVSGGRIVIADTMFRNAEHKAECLARHKDLEDEYQPLLDSFPAMFEAEGVETSVHQVSELFWVVVAAKPGPS